MKRRALFWTDSFAPHVGGVEVLAERYLCGLKKRGWEFVIATRGEGAALVVEDRYQEMPVHRLNIRAAMTSGDPRQLLQLRRAVTNLAMEFQPHLVHIYHAGMGAMLFDGLRDVPLLLTLHAHLPREHLRPRTAWATLLESVDFIACCSQSVAWDLKAKIPAVKERCYAIPNALEIPQIAPFPISFEPPKILALGRLVENKGFDIAVEVLARLCDQFPALRLTVAGNGPALPALIRQAEQSQVRERIDFPGWIAPAEIPTLINHHVLVLMPTRHREAFGLAALQAAQMARPVVAADTGGLPEVVKNEVTGLLVQPGDANAFVAATQRLLSQPEQAVAMGEAARVRAMTGFSWQAHLDAYEKLMQRLIEKSN